jgi:hypothetical protein
MGCKVMVMIGDGYGNGGWGLDVVYGVVDNLIT